MVPRLFQLTSRILVAFGLIAIAVALYQPAAHSQFLFGGIALVVGAYLFALWRLYVLRAPIYTRSGVVKFESRPTHYRIWFSVASLFGFFLVYVLLRSLR